MHTLNTVSKADERAAILVVDDDPHVLALIGGALYAADFDVLPATSAAMARERLAAAPRLPVLAIVDMHMPAVNGLQLMQTLDRLAPLPFMMMSASDSCVLVRRAAEHGAVGFLVKPLDPAQLVPAVITGVARGREIGRLRETESRLTAAMLRGRETAMAVGMVMERFRVDREAAFGALRQHARSNHRRLVDVAADYLNNTIVENGIAQRLAGAQR